MELSKVLDGFIDADTLIIKAQVQVIRFTMTLFFDLLTAAPIRFLWFMYFNCRFSFLICSVRRTSPSCGPLQCNSYYCFFPF